MSNMVLVPTLVFVLYLRSMSAIKCLSCDSIAFDMNNASLSTDGGYCEAIDDSGPVCTSELHVDLFDTYLASVRYTTASSNAFITGNGDAESFQTIHIPFGGAPSAKHSFSCYDEYFCTNQTVQKQYEQLRALNITALEKKMTDLLHSDGNILKQDQIECYNRNNKVEKCSKNGSCQATLIIEQGLSKSLVTTCIPDRRPGFTSGLTLQSQSTGNYYRKTTISYTCNKNLCNDPAIVHQIRQILFEADLVTSKGTTFSYLSSILATICVITTMWLH